MDLAIIDILGHVKHVDDDDDGDDSNECVTGVGTHMASFI